MLLAMLFPEHLKFMWHNWESKLNFWLNLQYHMLLLLSRTACSRGYVGGALEIFGNIWNICTIDCVYKCCSERCVPSFYLTCKTARKSVKCSFKSLWEKAKLSKLKTVSVPSCNRCFFFFLWFPVFSCRWLPQIIPERKNLDSEP